MWDAQRPVEGRWKHRPPLKAVFQAAKLPLALCLNKGLGITIGTGSSYLPASKSGLTKMNCNCPFTTPTRLSASFAIAPYFGWDWTE